MLVECVITIADMPWHQSEIKFMTRSSGKSLTKLKLARLNGEIYVAESEPDDTEGGQK